MPDPIPTPTIYAHPCIEVDWKPEQPKELRKARRIKGPIYEALLTEFYQDGCYLGARHFEYLVELERDFIERKHEIHYVYENEEFLLQLVENVKAAEQVFQLDKVHGIYVSRKLLNQTIRLAERENFDWLTQKLYAIIARYMLKTKTKDYLAMEQSTRFIFKYAKFLMLQGKPEHHQEATIVIPIAMEAACSEEWKPDTSPEDEIFSTLHAALGNLLANIYLIKAKQAGITQKHAIKHAQKALKAIARVGIQENKCVAFKAFLTKIEILMDADRYDWALRELLLLEKSVMQSKGAEFIESKLDLLKNIGITLCQLDQPIDAIENFGKALDICRKYNYSHAEGDILLQIGHAQRQMSDGALRAHLAFQLAKTHFEYQGDKSKALITKYLIAALKSNLINTDLQQLLHSNKYCDFYKLRSWKNRCEPFWDMDKQVGYIKQGVLANISMYTSENLYKLYNLVLNTRATIIEVKDTVKAADVESAYNEASDSLKRATLQNLYHSDFSVNDTGTEIEADADEEFYANEFEQNSFSIDMQGIEQSDTSQKIPQSSITANVRKYSNASSSRRSSSRNVYVWTVKDSDPLCCLLRKD